MAFEIKYVFETYQATTIILKKYIKQSSLNLIEVVTHCAGKKMEESRISINRIQEKHDCKTQRNHSHFISITSTFPSFTLQSCNPELGTIRRFPLKLFFPQVYSFT